MAQAYTREGLACAECGTPVPLHQAFWKRKAEGERDELLGLCAACAQALIREVAVVKKERLFALREDGTDCEVLEKPTGWTGTADPLRQLALLAGLEECPFHEGIFLRPDQTCPVCSAEAVEAALDVLRDEARERRSA